MRKYVPIFPFSNEIFSAFCLVLIPILRSNQLPLLSPLENHIEICFIFSFCTDSKEFLSVKHVNLGISTFFSKFKLHEHLTVCGTKKWNDKILAKLSLSLTILMLTKNVPKIRPISVKPWRNVCCLLWSELCVWKVYFVNFVLLIFMECFCLQLK